MISCRYWNFILHSPVLCLISAMKFSGLYVRSFPVLLLGIACSTCNILSKRSEQYGMSKCRKQSLPMRGRNGPFVGEMRTSSLPGMHSIGFQVCNTSTSSTNVLKFSSHILNPREMFNLRIYCVGNTLQTEKMAGPDATR
jgi:hypothetical protein